jgi:preprotein translocase SecE subunit
MENFKSGSQQNAYTSLKKAFKRFEDVKVEFKKIQWTEEKKPQAYVKVVVLATFFSGMVLYCADVVVHKFLWMINAFLRFLFG